MKFEIGQVNISKAVQVATRIILPRGNLPIIANLLIEAVGGKISILSTNLESAIKITIPSKVEREGKATISGKNLAEFIGGLGDEQLIFEKLGEEVVVVGKKVSARFATMPPEDFPAIPNIEKGTAINVPAGEFAKGVLRVIFSAAADEGRPVLAGVLCEFGKNNIEVVATDGYRLSFWEVELGKKEKKETPTLKINIPAKSLSEVAKIIQEGEIYTELEALIAENLSQVNFKLIDPKGDGVDIEFTSRLIEGEYPNWRKTIPETFTSKFKVSKGELLKIIKLASIFAREAGNIVKLKFEGGTGKGDGELSVTAQAAQAGSADLKIDVEVSGKGGEIAFNWRYVVEALSAIDGDDIYFEMIESLNPGRITPVDEKAKFFHIIMPVRLQS